jgi:hypothetical protein
MPRWTIARLKAIVPIALTRAYKRIFTLQAAIAPLSASTLSICQAAPNYGPLGVVFCPYRSLTAWYTRSLTARPFWQPYCRVSSWECHLCAPLTPYRHLLTPMVHLDALRIYTRMQPYCFAALVTTICPEMPTGVRGRSPPTQVPLKSPDFHRK